MGYGILTVSDQSLGVAAAATRGSRRGPSVVREAQTGGSGPRFRSSSRSISWCHARAPPADRASARRRHIHLRFEGADEAFPFSLRHRRLALRHQLRAGREVGKPDIEPVVGRIAFLPNATRRTPHRADPSSLLRIAGFTQADDPQGHDAPVRARAGLLFVFRPAGPMWANG